MFPFSGDPFSLRHGHSGDMRRVTFITRSETQAGAGQGMGMRRQMPEIEAVFSMMRSKR
jgi:hypothetical protein